MLHYHGVSGSSSCSYCSCCCRNSCGQGQGFKEDQSQGEGKFFWQSTVQGYGDGCHHHPEGEVRVFPGCHQEPSGQQVQGRCGQEGGYPKQGAQEDVLRRSTCSWCSTWKEGGRLFQGLPGAEKPHC